MTTIIEHQSCIFMVVIIINLEPGPGSQVPLNGRYQTKFNQVNLVPNSKGQILLICPILSLLSTITIIL